MPVSPIGKLPRPTLVNLRQRQQGASAYVLVVGLSLAAIAGIFIYESGRAPESETATSEAAVADTATADVAVVEQGAATDASGGAAPEAAAPTEGNAAPSDVVAQAPVTVVEVAVAEVVVEPAVETGTQAAATETTANAESAALPEVASTQAGITAPPTSPPAPPAPISDVAQSVNTEAANSAANAAEDMGAAMGFNAKARAEAEKRIRAMQQHMSEMMAAHPPIPHAPSAPPVNMDEPMVPPPGPAWAAGMHDQGGNARPMNPSVPMAPRMNWLDVPPAMAYPAPPVEPNPYLGYAPVWDGRPYFVPGYGYGWGW
ncbi:MAG: hypothetical protein H6981_14795 [Gammaproteobacteria bacterium]|nr:hypothetical protein [Gammaproteobacteria bacterium]MCP5138052.1 hypothetical protein [Gammaproteobacteria bacterium]